MAEIIYGTPETWKNICGTTAVQNIVNSLVETMVARKEK